MLDPLFGFVFLVLGIRAQPGVLGEETQSMAESATGSGQEIRGIRQMNPNFTPENLLKFQQDRKAREANLKNIGASRAMDYRAQFERRQAERMVSDSADKRAYEAKVNAFKNEKKKQHYLTLAANFQRVATDRLSNLATRLERMAALLDKLTAAAGALKVQGYDVSAIESDIAAAQAHVTSAQSALMTTVETLPTVFALSDEDHAKNDAVRAVAAMKSGLEPVHEAFTRAHEAVRTVLEDVEAMTNAREVPL